MKYSSAFLKGLLAALLIHGAVVVVAGVFLSADGRDKLMARTIEIHLSIPTPIPESLPVIVAKSKVEPKPKVSPVKKMASKPLPKPELKPEPELVAKKQTEQPPKTGPKLPVVKKEEPIPDLDFTQDSPVVDKTEELVQVATIEANDVTNQKQIDAIIKAETHYRDEVIRLIESKKYYPKRLQIMRKEGEVLVAFTLHRNGSVQDLEVVNVKGPALFKKAALKAIKSAASFPPFPEQSSRKTWSFRVPLSYRLLRT